MKKVEVLNQALYLKINDICEDDLICLMENSFPVKG